MDTVLKVEPSEGDGFMVAVELQTKPAPEKAANWAYYVAYLRAKYDLPVLLVAVCKSRSTASWATGPFECRVGPWATPARETWRGLQKMVATYFPGRGTLFEETYLKGRAEGKAEGEAKGILRVLEVRGLPVSDDVRERITSCTDLELLADWLDRSGTVKRAEDLFTRESEEV
ncbi:hypothetical protein ACIHCX_17760 [Streptomyces sp. NPDC052043]|uniref:hypothetical protein n=1 Tax=Streptomyces sp. NPDC052043 TaxID=3365684 RepID=UPI0037D42F1C